jgi:hypothetical protein
MSVTAICIRPIGTDLVALSALDTLVRKMGYEGSLLSLWREELWILGFDLEDATASQVTKMLMEKTGIFVNPNTHTHVVVCPDEMVPHGEQCGREELGILVWSREDPQIGPVTVAVRERMGIRNSEELRRLMLWWPRFAEGEGKGGECRGERVRNEANESSEGNDRNEISEKDEKNGMSETRERDCRDWRRGRNVREIATSMIATLSRKEGLLANPHYQCWSMLERCLRPHELLRTISEIEERWPRSPCR